MKYTHEIQSEMNDPEKLEHLYQQAVMANEEAEFRVDFQEAYASSPENVLLSAWRYRFEHLPIAKPRRSVNWGLAIVFGVITGLALWAISAPQWMLVDRLPYYMVFWAPISTIPALVFLALVSKKNYRQVAIAALGIIVVSVYVLLIAPIQSFHPSRDYLVLMAIELPLLCWIGIGIATTGLRSGHSSRFPFLIKSIEVMIAAGLYLIFGIVFGGITLGLFSALNIAPADIVLRLVGFGGFGLLPILALATMYDPSVAPEAQDFSQGLSRFIFTMMRLMLPLTILVLIIYIFVIPFNFMAPFQNRNLLIVYNVMQFAIIGLLIATTPLRVDDLSAQLQTWLRRAIIVVAILTLLISLYALSAVVYRTVLDHLTVNRTAIIGWNIINIVILASLVISQLRKGFAGWHDRLQNVFSRAAGAYLVWSILLVLGLPLIFR